MREMRRMCEFLGVKRTDDFLSRIRDNTTLTAMGTLKTKGDVTRAVFRKGKDMLPKKLFRSPRITTS